jgi:predicted phage gp36 major capsid-like protein
MTNGLTTDGSGAASPANGLLARTFESWRAEFRTILEDHRREIHQRLEQIEREIEKKSDKEHVDLLLRSVHEDLSRHSEDIKNLYASVSRKVGIEALWRVVGLVLALGGLFGSVIGFLVSLLLT